MLKVYLAGPDVFYPDAKERFEEMKKVLKDHGFEGISPLDGEAKEPTDHEIYRANIAKIRECDIVLANVMPFRGTEPDSGTVFEIGYADALGKEVYTYNESDYTVAERVSNYFSNYMSEEEAEGHEFPDGMKCETFGLKQNLMLHHSCIRLEARTGGMVKNFKEVVHMLQLLNSTLG